MYQVKVKRVDYLLITGLILAPMTGLRIWKVGPAEVLCFIWCLQYYREYGNLTIKNYLVSFWLVFFYIISLGTLYGLMFYPNESVPTQILTYLYLMIISFGVYIGMSRKTRYEIENILKKTAIFSAIWYLFLYLYSLFISNTFFNAPLWYAAERFSGGGTNPHQLAVLMSAVIFINYRNLIKSKKFWSKVIFLVYMIISTYIATATKSSTLILSILITVIIGMSFTIVSIEKNRKRKKILFFNVIIFALIIFFLSYNLILEKFYTWIQSDPNGIGRLEIFSSIGDTLSKNAIIGLGPGFHGQGGLVEYHNTYLEIIAMSGIMGFIVFVLFTKRIFKSLKVDYTLLLVIIPLYSYGFAGFAMRRLVYWVILVIIIVISEKMTSESNQRRVV